MTARKSSSALVVVAALVACKNPGAEGPEPGPPSADMLAAFDPAALADRTGPPPEPPPGAPLAVVDYGPQGRTAGGAAIKVRFNQPVVALGSEEIPDASRQITLDPPVEGRAFFQTPDLLVFQPMHDLAPATLYTVRLAAGLVGQDGQRLGQGLQWTFETPRPQVEGATPIGPDEGALEDLRRDTHIVLSFDHPTTLAEVRAHLRASARPIDRPDDAAAPVGVRVAVATRKQVERSRYWDYDVEVDRGRHYLVRPEGLWPGASEITLAVAPGLKSGAGPLPLDTPWEMSFTTYGPQAVTAFGCGGKTRCGLEPITMTLRNPVRERQAGKVSVSPRPKHLQVTVVDAYDDAGGTEIEVDGQFIPGTTYTVSVAPGLKDIYGQTLAGGFKRTVVVERRAELSLSTKEGTLIPARKQTIGVEARFVKALRVRAAVVREEDLAEKPWREVAMPAGARERTIALEPKGPAGWSSIALDVADLVGGARGPVMVEVVPSELASGAHDMPAPVRGLYRLTDLGPVVVSSVTKTAVQVLRLSDSTPVAGAQVSRWVKGDKGIEARRIGVTDADGFLIDPPGLSPYLGGPSGAAGEPEVIRRLLVVDPATGDRTAVATGEVPARSAESEALRPGERVLAKLVTDRGAYRPGEAVKVVGWSAIDSPHVKSGLTQLSPGTEVEFTLSDSTGTTVAERTTRTSREGKYWAELAIPAGGKLGRYTVRAAVKGATATADVKVEDYRVPEFQVAASVKKADILAGDRAAVRVAANYYFGGAVPIQSLTAQTSCTPNRYRPPGLDGTWVVGEPLDWRWRSARNGGRVVFGEDPQARPGLREVEVDAVGVDERFPHRCTISAEARDASYQAVGAETSVQVHPASFYLALAPPEGRRQAGERGAVRVRAVEIAGARVGAKGVKVMVERTWSEVKERAEAGRMVFDGWVEKSEKVKTCQLDAGASGDDARCELPTLKEGTYHVRAEVAAGERRTVRASGSFWVAPPPGPKRWIPGPKPLRLAVETSASSVTPGQPVDVAVQAPWQGGRGILVLDRQGVREVRPFALDAGTARFSFESDDTWTPRVHVRAFAVAPIGARGNTVKPEVHSAAAVVDQDAAHRRLQVRVEAPAKAGPGDRIELAAFVRDVAGAPVAGRVALWAVDEAVLALTDYEVPDLLPAFLPSSGAGASEYDDYRSVLWPYTPIADDPWMSGMWGHGSGYGLGAGGGGRGASIRNGASAVVPAARERFETTPVFLADLAVDGKGEARTRARLPDNLTTFRIFAVASARLSDGTSPGRFGVGDARTTVTTPFIVRAAAPRQLRPGDAAEVAAIVQNFTEVDGRAAVELVLHADASAKGQGLVAMSDKTVEIDVPAGGQARVPFQIRAGARGEAKMELRASLRAGEVKAAADAIKIALPVEPERTLTERVAMYGSLADERAIAIPVVMPGAVLGDVGGVTVSASASLLGGLEDAVDALLTYPYGCVEQTASRLLPVVALAALHETYPLGLDEDPKKYVQAGIERMLSMQTADGGFSYWPGGPAAHPYASAYATWVLLLAEKAGHKVPRADLDRALADLDERLARPKSGSHTLWDGDRLVRHAIGLHVLAEADRHRREAQDDLYQRRAELPAFGRAFLLMAMHRADPQRPEVQALTQELLGDLEELPATAHVIERSGWDYSPYFHSDGRSDAIVLLALLRARPEHAVIEKLARGLLERRIGGKWRNTQENAYALVALAEYARVREAEVPDFVGRAWVGRKPVFEASFIGRDLKTQEATTKMPEILRPEAAAKGSSAPLTVVLQRRGQGRMYYRLGAEWAPADPSPPARAHGLEVTRRLRLADGALGERPIEIGDAVAIDLTLTSRTRIRYVALDVPIPAGLEAVQLELGKGQRAARLSGSRGSWVSHEELRRDRAVVFADDLPPGTHHHTVFLRATSRGEYQLPPTRAEAMYMPEVWGRSDGARVAVR